MGKLSKKAKKALLTARAAVPKSVKKQVKNEVSRLIRSGSAAAGASIGAYAGQPALGSIAGTQVGKRLSKAIGSGDYEIVNDVKANSLFKGDGPSLPSFGGSSATRFKHREYIGDVYAGANNSFSIQKWAVQPAYADSFPFLSQLTRNFTRYHMKGLIYEFVSTTSPYLAGGAMGSVILAMQYDPTLPDFSTKAQMDNSDFAISVRPDSSVMYGVECMGQPVQGYYLRTGGTLINQPLNFTDMGNMYVGVQNTTIAAGTSLGELWVTYDVEMSIPRISPARYGFLRLGYNAPAAGSTTAFYNTQFYSTSQGELTATTIEFNGGKSTGTLRFIGLQRNDILLLNCTFAMTTTSAFTSTWVTGNLVDCEIATDASGNAAGAMNFNGSNLNSAVLVIAVRITGDNPRMAISVPSVTTATSAYTYITITDMFGAGGTL